MGEPTVRESLAEVVGSLMAYVRDHVTLYKLEATEKLARLGTSILVGIVFIVGGAFLLLFLSLAFVWWFGSTFGSYAVAFLIVAGIWVLALVLVYIFRRKIIMAPLVRGLRDIFWED